MRGGEPETRTPAPNVRFPLLRGCALIAGILLLYLFFGVWALRLMEWVGRGPALITSAAACAIILLALRAMALRVRLAPYPLRRWQFQLEAMLLALLPLLAYVVAATVRYRLWWATLGSILGFVLALWLVPDVMLWRRRGGMGVRDERES